MKSKLKACCANCEYRYGNTYTESTPPCPVAIVADKNDFKPFVCAEYDGWGITPAQEIAELAEENRRLREAYDTASGYVRASKYNILESKKERYWRAIEILKECHQIIKFGKVLKKR